MLSSGAVMFATSLSSSRRWKYFLWFIGCASFSISGLAQPMFFAVRSTPYDKQMAPAYPILHSANAPFPASPVSLTNINQWMEHLRAIPYEYSRQWKTVREMRFAQTADCKTKALLLYAQMRANGARNIRFVIGKHRADGPRTHAWLQWDTENGNYILDPTFNTTVTRQETDSWGYIALYAYDSARKYRAANATFSDRPALRGAPPAINRGTNRAPRTGSAHRIPPGPAARRSVVANYRRY